MRITSEWPSLVHALMTERGLSERKLASVANVHRSTLRRFFRGEAYHMPVEHLERLLAVFGYELDAMLSAPYDREGGRCPTPHRPSAHVVA
ncbi:helix-turn-helix transcriptional regulator [Shinella zoogloeoides]|uniref:helix-turn-helix domain-containing protein n=1 Tax=Shinella zoogloeoides TaxID=352475 RepID=UPI0028A67482|nr:helix-turn-helix transcriptional regulator [Shinella zoogloeoides]